MSWDGRDLAILAATVLAAFAVLASAAMLVADVAVARKQAPVDVARLEALAGRVKSDAGAAAELEAEKQVQTETSLAREAIQQRLGWVLLVAAAAFVTGAKRLLRGEGRRPTIKGACQAPLHGISDAPGNGARRALAMAQETPESKIDLAFVDDLVAHHGRGREAAIPILQAIQEHHRYLPEAALRRLCELTEITPAQIAGTSTFYARFRHSPVGEHLVRVCHGTACHVAGARHVDEELRRRLAIPPGSDTDPRRRFTLEPVACVGCCSLAPVMMIGNETAGHLTPATAGDRLVDMAKMVAAA